MKGHYQFICVDHSIYIHVDERLLSIYVLLLFRMKPFDYFHRKTKNSFINRCPLLVIQILRVSQFIYQFCQKRKGYRKGKLGNVLSSKHYGHLLLSLRQGEYKVFNLKRKHVITVYPEQIKSRILQDVVEKNKNLVKKSHFVPRVTDWNIKKDYLVEEYINFYRPSYSLNRMNRFHNEVVPILEEIRSMTPSQSLIDQDYYETIINQIKSFIKDISIDHQETIQHLHTITDFIDYLSIMLQKNANKKDIDLVISHGDFWEGNLLIKRGNLKVIDWNTLGYRSCYFDFFYMLFMLASKQSRFDQVDPNGLNQLNIVLNPALIHFNSQKKQGFNEIDVLNEFNFYRYLFYLELIALKLNNDGSFIENDQIKEVITWIRRFECYERLKEKAV